MQAIQRVIKTNQLNYQLVRMADAGAEAKRYAILAPDGGFIDEGLDISEGLEALYFIDPKGMH